MEGILLPLHTARLYLDLDTPLEQVFQLASVFLAVIAFSMGVPDSNRGRYNPEAARVALLRGHRVTLVEREDHVGGLARAAGPHGALIDWYEREHARLGTNVVLGHHALDGLEEDTVIVQCSGSLPGRRDYEVEGERKKESGGDFFLFVRVGDGWRVAQRMVLPA